MDDDYTSDLETLDRLDRAREHYLNRIHNDRDVVVPAPVSLTEQEVTELVGTPVKIVKGEPL